MTFFTDVKVSDEYRLGEVNNAAKPLGFILSQEQGGHGWAHGQHKAMTDEAAMWALTNERNG